MIQHTKQKNRYCAFIIWGNGLEYTDSIISMIRSNQDFEIKELFFYEPDNIGHFVESVYSKDYAPFSHLRSKTKYLRKSDRKVMVIFVLNKNPQEKFFGDGEFRHLECALVKQFKEEVRNCYNPKNSSGERSEEHVIHATDSEYQVDWLLNLLGHPEGIAYFDKKPRGIIQTPHYMRHFSKFKLKKIAIDSLHCNIIHGTRTSFNLIKSTLEESPHYAFLSGDTTPYKKYLADFGGYLLRSDYSLEKFERLASDFSYEQSLNALSYILVKEITPNSYLIHDGAHRACIMKSRGHRDIIVAII